MYKLYYHNTRHTNCNTYITLYAYVPSSVSIYHSDFALAVPTTRPGLRQATENISVGRYSLKKKGDCKCTSRSI